MFRRPALILAAAALLLPAAASAQDDRPTPEMVMDLAYGLCPLYLGGSFTLTGNEQLVARGFTGARQTSPNPRFGEIEFLGQVRGDAEITFGGVSGQICQVNVIGGDPAAILAKLREGMTYLPYSFEPDPANSRTAGTTSAETLKANVDGAVLRVQFVRGVVQGKPLTGFQIFGMDQ